MSKNNYLKIVGVLFLLTITLSTVEYLALDVYRSKGVNWLFALVMILIATLPGLVAYALNKYNAMNFVLSTVLSHSCVLAGLWFVKFYIEYL